MKRLGAQIDSGNQPTQFFVGITHRFLDWQLAPIDILP
ncbi:hypothetical protein B0G69_6911 [Paraburkholderia sp. RAU2J]|nr:hypothetical protein B0G69_6911 [Paraburkholderia sp. RAU2J]